MRLALLIEYFGKSFHGSQYQVGVRTVQSDLESALSTLARSPVTALFSGRTDTGVHAAGQVVHCEWPENEVDIKRFCWALNGILKKDLSVVDACVVTNEFHARRSAIEREYVYRILNRPQRSPLLKNTHYFVRAPLDTETMKAAAGVLLGLHDFSGFKSSNSDNSSTECEIRRADLLKLGEGRLEFWIAADHFVYNMVRIIVGTLIEIGLGKMQPEAMGDALAGKARDLAGPTAPAWGLTLNSVKYPEAFDLFDNSKIQMGSQF